MTSVFLSYDREDSDKAQAIALALERVGHTVWWDRRIQGGAQFNSEIQRALNDADVVIVLWSEAAVESPWVRDEAAVGRDAGKFIPVQLDNSQPPLGFRQFQTIDLSKWTGNARSRALKALLGPVASARPGTSQQPAGAAEQTSTMSRLPRRRAIVAGIVAIVLIAAALLFWRPWVRQPASPIVAVRAGSLDADSKALARSILVQIGAIESVRANGLQLIDETAGETPDLIVEVSGNTTESNPTANLVLFRARDRELLASQDFAAPGGSIDDLRQSLAMSAARLLGCAAEALPPRGRLHHSLLRTYLGACGRFATMYGHQEVGILVPQFEEVVRRQPAFVPAWRQLLLAEASIQALPSDTQKPSTNLMRDHIVAAERVQSDLPEAGVAKLELLPVRAFGARLSLADELVRRFPNHPIVLNARADQLMRVGRMNDAVIDTEKAALLDPASPFTRNAYIRALAYSGRVSRAFQELQEAAPLALGARNLTETRFRLNMRYGDPRLALQLLRSHGTSKQHEAFLLARISPAPATVDRALAVSRSTVAQDIGATGAHSEVLAAFGRGDEIYEHLMLLPPGRFDGWLAATLFRPNLQLLRQDPRFLNIAQRFGILDFWRKTGKWPDFCSEPGLTYDCQVEAAKIN